jgi:hypothetical protein
MNILTPPQLHISFYHGQWYMYKVPSHEVHNHKVPDHEAHNHKLPNIYVVPNGQSS